MAFDPHDYNKGGFLAFVFSMVTSVLFFIYICFFHPGVDLDKPKVKATVGATQADAKVEAKPGVDMSANPKPWLSSSEFIAYGKEKYKTNCSFCHGETGLGDGPAGAALNPKPRNFVEGKWKKGGTAKELFITIRDGMPGTPMAAFKNIPVVDRWAIVHFIRSISKNSPDENPAELEKFAQGEK